MEQLLIKEKVQLLKLIDKVIELQCLYPSILNMRSLRRFYLKTQLQLLLPGYYYSGVAPNMSNFDAILNNSNILGLRIRSGYIVVWKFTLIMVFILWIFMVVLVSLGVVQIQSGTYLLNILGCSSNLTNQNIVRNYILKSIETIDQVNLN